MSKQVKHVRVSKNGKPFRAGSKKVPVELPKPVGFCRVKIEPLSRAFFTFLKDWSKEVTLEFIKDKGIRVFGMDPANVTLIDYTFSCIVNQSLKKAVNTKDLFDAIRKAHRNDVLDFVYETVIPPNSEDNKPNEFILVKNVLQNYTDRLVAYNLDEKELKSPTLDKANYSMLDWQGSVFYDIIDKATKAPNGSDSIVFHGYEGRMVYAVPLDTHFVNAKGEVEMALTGTIKGLTHAPNEVVKAKYSIPYLRMIARVLKYWPPQDKITLKFGTDYPLEITDTPFVRFKYIIAPRIEND